MRFSTFFADLLAKMIPQCEQMCHLGSPGRCFVATFLSLFPTLLFTETIMFYYGLATFALVPRAPKTKNVPRSQHFIFFASTMSTKYGCKSQMGSKITKTRPPWRYKWEAWQRPELLISPGATHVHHSHKKQAPSLICCEKSLKCTQYRLQ
jgi:hypothetical protein